MEKHLGVFITLMNSHLNVSLKCVLRVITHHVTHLRAWATGGMWGIMYMGCVMYWVYETNQGNIIFCSFFA